MQGHKKIWWLLAVVGLFFISVDEAKAQRIAVSTNSLEWLTLSPNLSFDVTFTQHHAFALSVSTSPWKVSKKLYLAHITVVPEYKYWIRMPFYGSYIGANLQYSSYDIAGGNFASKGNLVAAGFNYGYSFIVGKKWNVVPFLGAGVGVAAAPKAAFAPVARLGVNIQMVIR